MDNGIFRTKDKHGDDKDGKNNDRKSANQDENGGKKKGKDQDKLKNKITRDEKMKNKLESNKVDQSEQLKRKRNYSDA